MIPLTHNRPIRGTRPTASSYAGATLLVRVFEIYRSSWIRVLCIDRLLMLGTVLPIVVKLVLISLLWEWQCWHTVVPLMLDSVVSLLMEKLLGLCLVSRFIRRLASDLLIWGLWG